MSDEKGVSEATEVVETTSQEPTAESSVEDIIDYRHSQEEAESSEESPSSETEQSDEPGEGEKTPEGEVDTPEKSDDEVVGDPIPYDRFKQVNDLKNQYETDLDKSRTDLKEVQESLKNPEVLRLVLKNRGYSEEAISKYMQENDITEPQKIPDTEHDFTSVEGWQDWFKSEMQKGLQPIQQALTRQEQNADQAENDRIYASQLKEAGELAKEVYGIENFGDPNSKEDMANPETAVNKIDQYLKANPGDQGLGMVRSLKLAMSGQAIQQAEVKGAEKEKERQAKVKSAAMESESTTVSEESPDPNWSVDKIMEWRQTHGKDEE